jgi:hypothetical protein
MNESAKTCHGLVNELAGHVKEMHNAPAFALLPKQARGAILAMSVLCRLFDQRLTDLEQRTDGK